MSRTDSLDQSEHPTVRQLGFKLKLFDRHFHAYVGAEFKKLAKSDLDIAPTFTSSVLVASELGIGTFVLGKAHQNGVFPWAKLVCPIPRQAAWRLGALLSLLFVIPHALNRCSDRLARRAEDEIGVQWRRDFGQRLIDGVCLAGVTAVFMRDFRDRQVVWRGLAQPARGIRSGRLGIVGLAVFSIVGAGVAIGRLSNAIPQQNGHGILPLHPDSIAKLVGTV